MSIKVCINNNNTIDLDEFRMTCSIEEVTSISVTGLEELVVKKSYPSLCNLESTQGQRFFGDIAKMIIANLF